MYSRGDWFFWSDVEKDNVAAYREPDADVGWGTHTLVNRLMCPLVKAIADRVPDKVAPNVITIAGLVTLFHGAYLSHKHSETYPLATSFACAILATAYYLLDAIDGFHAIRIRNRSNLGFLMVTTVNSAAPVLLMVMCCRTVLGITSLPTVWYAVQSGQLFFLFIHLRELHGTSRHLVRWFIPGPAALVPMIPLLCLLRAGFELISDEAVAKGFELWWTWVRMVVEYVETLPGCQNVRRYQEMAQEIGDAYNESPERTWHDGFLTFYVMCFIAVVGGCLWTPKVKRQTQKRNGATTSPTKLAAEEDFCKSTQHRLLICLAYRMVPALVMNFGMAPEVTFFQILVDGLFLSVLMTDMVVAKMARRSLHPWIIIFCMVSVLDLFVETLLCVFYIASIFYDLSEHMKMPLFTVQKNVYVDGIYDLCHIGHMRMFAASAKFGNSLLVGVVNDEDATPYKRKPIMTSEERCAEVGACKYVNKVIPNAPADGIPLEFIEKHNIHLVVCGEEYYDRPGDHYYAVPRELGILQKAPRTQGMSTSDLIKRISSADPDSLDAKDKIRKAKAEREASTSSVKSAEG